MVRPSVSSQAQLSGEADDGNVHSETLLRLLQLRNDFPVVYLLRALACLDWDVYGYLWCLTIGSIAWAFFVSRALARGEVLFGSVQFIMIR